MRPVSEQFPVTQGFGSLATRGVVGSWYGTEVQYLVAEYGDYQPDGHNGADIGCPVGTPVRAARAGTVVLCDWDVNLPGDDSWSASGYFQRFAFFKRFGGRLLVVKVAENDYDVYAHLSAWKVGYGQTVSEGQLVALSGDSSAGKDGQLGAHLHTERIVDLTYPTGGGLIFGRADPTTVWGGLAAMGGTITPLTQEDDMAFTPEQEDFILKSLGSLVDNVATKKDIPTQAENRFTQAALASLVNNVATKADLSGVSAAVVSAAKSGASADEIKAVVDAAMAAGLKVDVTVNGGK